MSSYRSFREIEEETDGLEDDLVLSRPKSGQISIGMPVGLATFDDVVDYSIRRDLGDDIEDEEEEEFIAGSDQKSGSSTFLKKYINGDEDLTEEERKQCRMHKIILITLTGGLILFVLILVFVQYGQ